jgi:hypothetical protein
LAVGAEPGGAPAAAEAAPAPEPPRRRYELPDFALAAFDIRYAVEQELLKAFARVWPDRVVPATSGRIIVALENAGLFSHKEGFGAALREFMSVTKNAMRGHEPAPTHVDFLRQVGPAILRTIQRLKAA